MKVKRLSVQTNKPTKEQRRKKKSEALDSNMANGRSVAIAVVRQIPQSSSRSNRFYLSALLLIVRSVCRSLTH